MERCILFPLYALPDILDKARHPSQELQAEVKVSGTESGAQAVTSE